MYRVVTVMLNASECIDGALEIPFVSADADDEKTNDRVPFLHYPVTCQIFRLVALLVVGLRWQTSPKWLKTHHFQIKAIILSAFLGAFLVR
jgi:hypothetical protein